MMSKGEDLKVFEIQSIVLKVNIHCDGCSKKVKKLLHKIEGVDTVKVDKDSRKVTVLGKVNSATLIGKLIRGGKHAELWSQKPSAEGIQQQKKQKQQKRSGNNKVDRQKKQGRTKGFRPSKNQQHSEDEETTDDEDDPLQLVNYKSTQVDNNGNDVGRAAVMGNNNILAFHQHHHQPRMPPPMVFPSTGGGHRRPQQPSPLTMAGSNLQGAGGWYQTHHHPSPAAAMVMDNLSNREGGIQPHTVHNRATHIAPYTGYRHPSPFFYHHPSDDGTAYGVHLFSDDNPNSCSVM